MSELVKKYNERWDCVGTGANDPEFSTYNFYGFGIYEYVLEKYSKMGVEVEKTKEVQGSMSYSKPSQHNKKANYFLTFNDHKYLDEFVEEVLKFIGPQERIEEWKTTNQKGYFIHVLVFVDARGECALIAEKQNVPADELVDDLDISDLVSDEELEKMGNLGQLVLMPDEVVVGSIESMLINTFDPFDF